MKFRGKLKGSVELFFTNLVIGVIAIALLRMHYGGK
jgi:hypothetical protein